MANEISKNEIPMVSYLDAAGNRRFLLTVKQTRDFWYLYELAEDGTAKKLGRGKSPPELEERFEVEKRIRAGSCKRGADRIK